MKRFFRFLTFVGSIGAVAWLLRDRLVSVTTSREPEPPQFVPEPSLSEVATGDHLPDINGIGPTYAGRLAANGISSFADLAAADASAVSDAIDVPESRVTLWIEQAREM